MRIPQTRMQMIKAGLHIGQAALVVLVAILSLAVLAQSGGDSGSIGTMFGLCFLTLPALIYQIMVPMWTRAWRFANVYAYATIDMAFALLWFALSIAVAVWESQSTTGVEKGKSDSRVTSHFAHGSETRRSTGSAAAAFGFLIFLLFIGTSGLSVQQVVQYKRTGINPGRPVADRQRLDVADPDKDTWSVKVDDLGSQQVGDHAGGYVPGAQSAYGQVPQHEEEEDRHGLLQHNRMSGYSMNDNVSFHSQNRQSQPEPLSLQSFETLSTMFSHGPQPEAGSRISMELQPTSYVSPASLAGHHRPSLSEHRASFPPGDYHRLSTVE